MKSAHIIFTAALLLSGSQHLDAQSIKRGVSENQFQFKAQMEAIAPGACWYYNWGAAPGRYLANETCMEFVPMCWNGNYNATSIRNYVKEHPEVKYLLGFNEPNFTAQANMTPAQAAEQWAAVQALAKEFNLKLVAPALNYSPNAPYQDPTQWMDEFVQLVGNDAFDYVAIHSYGGFGVMKDLATTFHERYGKEVWVTEFCYWPNEGDPNSTVSPESQIASMVQSLEWLEKTEWIHRYAWFKAIGESSASRGPNYGLILSGKAEAPRELSEQGKVYVNLWDFDTKHYNLTGEWVAAKDFIAQNAVTLGTSADPEGAVIEINRFNAGASLDYQFEVPSAGDYILTMRVSGQGEPVRFDPTVGIYTVDAEGNEVTVVSGPTQFSLTGDNDAYKEVRFSMQLEAGKQTLRIKDTAPGQPSGMHISVLRLADATGVDLNVVDDDDKGGNVIHDLLGRRVDTPTRGFYIINGKKTIIH